MTSMSETRAAAGRRLLGGWIRGVLWMAATACGVLALLVGSVLLYHWRLQRPHAAALRRLLAATATLEQVEATYGPPLPLNIGKGPCPAAAGWGAWPDVQRKCAEWPLTRTWLVQASEFIYVIYFDSGHRMRDFTLIEN